MSEQSGTSWIQKLNKKEVTAELKKRNIECSDIDEYDNLREILRKAVKQEIAEREEAGKAESDSEEDNMAGDGMRLEFL